MQGDFMIDEPAMPTLMTATQLSKMFGVHVNTIWRWVEQEFYVAPIECAKFVSMETAS